ncbi:SDR family oxidoreductase [Candidatus Bathyarchaeota archaeon]|nr:MAG: SDR family oxidoreductase [Candidatus Bathyarchaeota archaeon]
MGRLDGKIAVITGCRRGFGEAMAERFAEEGAAVSICDTVPVEELWENVGEKIIAGKGKVLCHQTDVSKENQVNAMVRETIKEYGTIDILVNNVGIAGPTKAAWELSYDEWNKTLEVNLGGLFLCTKAAVPEMIKKKSGRVINFSSVVAKNPYPYRTPYATTKMGVIGFTRILALEVGRYNITANSICPGNPGGERNIEVLRDHAMYAGKSFDEAQARSRFKLMREKGVLGGKYLGDEGYVEVLISHLDVANLAVFLASDEAAHITGQDINVCAGTTMW